MQSHAFVRDMLAAKPPTSSQAQAALAQAATLQACAGRPDLRLGLLKGRRVGLMCPTGDSECAQLFCRAAIGLGARVSYIQADLDRSSSAAQIEATARVLSRLYDAVECQGMDLAVIRRLGNAAAIPVFPGLACQEQSFLALAEELQGEASLDEKKVSLVQALLLSSID